MDQRRRLDLALPPGMSQVHALLSCFTFSRVIGCIGDTRLCKLTPADVRAMYRRLLTDGLTASTVGNLHATVKQSFRDAVRDRRIRTNPLDDVKPPKESRTVKDVLTPDEVRRLLEAVRGDRFECAFYPLCTSRVENR